MAISKATEVSTGASIREKVNSLISNSASAVSVSNGNIVTTKNDGSTSSSAVASNLKITVTASTQSAISSALSGGADDSTIKAVLPTVVTGVAANTYTLQNLLQQLVNKSHTHNSVTSTTTSTYDHYNCYYDSCSSSSCIVKGKISTDSGDIEIENLNIGDMLLGLDGKYHKVVGLKKSTIGNRKAIFFDGVNSGIFTDDHLFISYDNSKYAAYDINGYIKGANDSCDKNGIYGTYSRLEQKEIINLKENNLTLKLLDERIVSYPVHVIEISSDTATYSPIVEDCEWIYVNNIPAACMRYIND